MRRLLLVSGKSRREVHELGWCLPKHLVPCPWDNGKYARVIIPYTPAEQARAKDQRQAHIQIVRRDKLIVASTEVV